MVRIEYSEDAQYPRGRFPGIDDVLNTPCYICGGHSMNKVAREGRVYCLECYFEPTLDKFSGVGNDSR